MSAWQDGLAATAERLSGMSSGQRSLFSVGVAERLIRAHLARPVDEHAPFTLSLRPLLGHVWDGACGDPAAFRKVARGLGEFYLSDFCHNEGQDGPDDADEDAACAVLYAAECYMHGLSDFAALVSSRALDAADLVVQRRRYEESSDFAPECESEAAMLVELTRQSTDLDLIARHAADVQSPDIGLPAKVGERLRRLLRPALSQP